MKKKKLLWMDTLGFKANAMAVFASFIGVVSILIAFSIVVRNDEFKRLDETNKNLITALQSDFSSGEEYVNGFVQVLGDNSAIEQAIIENDVNDLRFETDKFTAAVTNDAIVFLDASGKVIFKNDSGNAVVNSPEAFTKLKGALNNSTVSVTVNKEDGVSFFVTSTPIRYDGNVIGMVAYGVSTTAKYQLRHVSETSPSDIVIYENGIAKTTSPLQMSHKNKIDSQLLKKITSSKTPVTGRVNIDGRKYYGTFVPMKFEGGTNVIAAISLESKVNAKIWKSILILGVVGLFSLILMVIILQVYIGRRIVGPIGYVTGLAHRLANGDSSFDVDKAETNDEIGRLLTSFHYLVKANKHKIDVVNQVAAGNIQNLQVVSSEQDQLAHSINYVIETLTEFESNIQHTAMRILNGELNHRLVHNQYNGVYQNILIGINSTLDALAKQIDHLPNPLFTLDRDLRVQYINEAGCKFLGREKEEIVGNPYYESLGSDHFDIERDLCHRVIQTGEPIHSSGRIINYKKQEFNVDFAIFPIFDSEGMIAGAYETIVDQTEMVKIYSNLQKQASYQEQEVQQLIKNIEKLSNGQFDLEFKSISYDDDTKEIHEMFDQINKNLATAVNFIRHYVEQISNVLAELANSNLDLEITEDYIGDFSSIKVALLRIIESLNGITSDIMDTSALVATGSHQISDSSQSLSQGATQQAAAIEEISVTIANVAQQARKSAEQVSQVNVLADESKAAALLCDNLMQQMTTSMDEISDASENISKVLKMINDIAFQTNILSLNAAVEAARAGQHGKGFAVIAEDVRNLALKSASAADETSDMIEAIIKKIKTGNDLANSTADSLREILDGAINVAKISKNVAHSSNEQATSIQQITVSIDQISHVVQETSANAQQGASSSKELSNQANRLTEIISRFNLKNKKNVKYNLNKTSNQKIEEMIREEHSFKKEQPIRILLDDTDFGKY